MLPLRTARLGVVVALLALVSSAIAFSTIASDDPIVYRGQTGTKYHRQSCRTLKGKGIPIRLSEAKAEGREPCKVCKPGG